MKIAIAQNNYHIGNFKENIKKIKESIIKAKDGDADLVIFSELSVSGYPPQDLLEQKNFVSKCENSILEIAKVCNGIAAVVGNIKINQFPRGKKLYNSAYFLYDGEVQEIHHKGLLPTYDIFDEDRYFEANKLFSIIEFKGEKIALTICEDLWEIRPTDDNFQQNFLYKNAPMQHLILQNPTLIINIAASPFSYRHIENRKKVLKINAEKYRIPIFYVNQTGANTEIIFDGGSMVINKMGRIIEELKYFEEDFKIIDLERLKKIPKKEYMYKDVEKHSSYIEKIYNALIIGTKDYFTKSNFTKANLGLSGGIDSAVTLVIAVRALGNENVKVMMMPSKYSSEHSIKDAIELAEKLSVKYEIINIENVINSIEKTMQPIFNGLPEDTTEENIQARTRGLLLMAFANKFSHILLNTSNKSESAVGYGTLYGDMNGGLSILGDVYKKDVFELAKFINKSDIIIPINTIEKPPSAELKANQKDSDSLPDYDILDKILYEYIELKKSPEEIANEKISLKLVKDIIKKVNQNEYKRYQAPPILRISSKAFGVGRRIPLVAVY